MKRIESLLLLMFLLLQLASAQEGISNECTYNDFKTEFIWDAKVTIGEAMIVGKGKLGKRIVIPITGGTFKGSKVNGIVLPGGEDCQLVRPDGDVEFNARYWLKTSDGHTIQVENRALMHSYSPKEEKMPYLKSVLNFEAPVDSPYDYLNHAIFIGTLKVPELKPGETPYVIIGVYKLL